MNSKELFDLLERLSSKDIQVMATMSVRYLVKSRNKKLNEILRDIKKVNKAMGV